MKTIRIISMISLIISCLINSVSVMAQNDSMFIMKSGLVIGQFKLAEIDSIIFNKPGYGGAFQCGDNLVVNHVAGLVAPVNKTTLYGTVTNIPGEVNKCWITSNLGSDHQAVALNDGTEESAGWYWQFNRKQGYKHDGSIVLPIWTITSISEDSDWQAANDPCSLELVAPWRIPTFTEWSNVDNAGGWDDWTDPWNSGLKLHAAGYLIPSDGSLYFNGATGFYWSGTQKISSEGRYLEFDSGACIMRHYLKAQGFSIRCIRIL